LPGLPGGTNSDGGGTNSSDGGGITNYGYTLPNYTITTNYANYTNIWLTASNNSTNTLVTIESTLSNLTYEILTNGNLATTNWGVWQTLTASNSATTVPPLAPNSRTLFCRGRLVWETGTNGLPDWWQMEYFNQLNVNPTGNSAGDGINNLNKYLMGLNPNVAYDSSIIINPPGGDYVSMPSISIVSLTGSPIIYTTNGSTPSATNGISITSGVPITNLPGGSFTLEAWESGLTPNVPVSAAYTIIPATPTFSIPGGLYAVGTTLQISCATTNATVHYTTNGIDPTINSPQIQATNAITMLTNQTVKAVAWLGTNASPVASATCVLAGPPLNDDFSNATVLTGLSGTLIGTTLAATIEPFEEANPDNYFFDAVHDGNSVWYQLTALSNSNVFFDYSKCAHGIDINCYYFPSNSGPNPTNLAPTSYSLNSDYTSFTLPVTQGVTYYISISYQEVSEPFDMPWRYVSPSATPIFTPDAGTYLTSEPVVVSCNDTNAVMHYTTNGVDPTTNDAVIVSGNDVLISQTTTLKAMSLRAGLAPSAVKTALYTINPSSTNPTLTASSPTLFPGNTNFATSLAVTLSCTNTGAVIYYTLDGSTPTGASASVPSGGTVTLTTSTPLNASAWAPNMNLSSITTGWYAKNGVDSTGDGIMDSGALIIGTDPFVSDAYAANPNPFAYGLDNMQVYQNQSVLLANNYSTLGDGIPDWWLVKNGYSVTTSGNALGANGQTLLASFLAGLNPNNSNSRPGQLPPIDFHMVHGPLNSMVMVLDTVTTNIVNYLLNCTETDPAGPLYNQTIVEPFPTNAAIAVPGQQWGRYFQLTNQLPAGNWLFTLQGASANKLLSQMSSNTFGRYKGAFSWDVPIDQAETSGGWSRYAGVSVPIVSYTNNNSIKYPLLAQIARAESDVWHAANDENGINSLITSPVLYDTAVQSLTTQESWGTLTFQYTPGAGYSAIDFASYFTSICATGDPTEQCGAYYTNINGGYSFPSGELAPLQTDADNSGNLYFIMPHLRWERSDEYNPAGLKYLSETYRVGDSAPVTLTPGQSNIIPWGVITFEAALNTETPTFQPVNYFFDGRSYPLSDNGGNAYESAPPATYMFCSPLPATDWMTGYEWIFPIAITNPVIVAQVGRPVNLQCWAQEMAVRPNGKVITNQIYCVDQDFAQAYLCNPVTGDVPRTSQTNYNGTFKIDTNNAITTGVLSPNLNYPQNYGETLNGWRSADFTPTQPGKVIVTTMPDDNGNYGEITIYVIDMQVDANHDGVMDNRDLTSVDNPMVFWVNNNFDRYVPDADDGVSYVDDVATNDPTYSPSPGTPGVPTPDYAYLAGNGTNIIPNLRDLEDYTRLWIPGLSNMVANLPTNYTVTLQWRNNTGAAIRLFKAAETNGGTNYQFNQSEGLIQLLWDSYPCYGFVSPSQTISLDQAFVSTTVPKPSDYFIFCGAAVGNDELVCQVKNPWGGVAGEASVFLNLKDIKQMYERWSVGESISVTPNTIATNCGDDGSASFSYPYDPSVDSTTPYILYVHGWNMETWEKDRFAESAFKRLYWQGYQGRLGVFRWPTGNGFVGISTLATDPTEKDNYDLSEYQAWQSATGLKNRLTALDTQYPGQVYMLAHSMGNVVASEALRLAGTTNLVNTYVASQAALPAEMYDPTVLDYSFYYPPWVLANVTPDIDQKWFATNNGNAAGQIISFYNTNDYALARGRWQLDQLLKPDQLVLTGGAIWDYGYSGNVDDPPPWNHFYKEESDGLDLTNFNIVTNLLNRYEVMALAAQPYTTALGATPGVNNVFLDVNLDRVGNNAIWPGDPTGQNYVEHFWHSAQFRGDYWQQQGYWIELLGSEAFNLK
jgi:hypothetical protein